MNKSFLQNVKEKKNNKFEQENKIRNKNFKQKKRLNYYSFDSKNSYPN